MKILGINVFNPKSYPRAYDGGACLLVDGEIVGAIAEERISRQKHDPGHEKATRFLLRNAGLEIKDLDLVVMSCTGEEPRLELFSTSHFEEAKRVEIIPSHHLSHAYSAFIPSSFSESLILVADNEGSIIGSRSHSEMWKNRLERLTLYRGCGTEIDVLDQDMTQENVVSLGEMYGNVTKYLGFGGHLNAGTTMALAAFGDARGFHDVSMIELLPEGRIRCCLDNNYLNSSSEISRYFELFGYSLPEERKPGSPMLKIFQDLAAKVQSELESAILHKLKFWLSMTGSRRLCLAGGVALNCVANKRLFNELDLEEIYVQPNSGDQGQCLGNALYGWHRLIGSKRRPIVTCNYLGGEYSSEDCGNAVSRYPGKLEMYRSVDVVEETAELLDSGLVLGWFQGRSEWGPRALGNRSILADPRNESVRERINQHIKQRESFRPFAPVVPLEEAANYFHPAGPCSSMTLAVDVHFTVRSKIPAVVHVDGTARLQTVTVDQNQKLYNLLRAFERRTQTPVLLNTSFNGKGEPIVETPDDAIECFLKIGLDALIMGDMVIKRSKF